MKPAELYHSVPHKPMCDCLGCKMIRRVQQDAYGEGHQDGYLKAKSEALTAVNSVRPSFTQAYIK
jgi:hypothetical protein